MRYLITAVLLLGITGCCGTKVRAPLPEEVPVLATRCEILALADIGAVTEKSQISGGYFLFMGEFSGSSSSELQLYYLGYAKNLDTGAIKLKKFPADDWDLTETDSTPEVVCYRIVDDWRWRCNEERWVEREATAGTDSYMYPLVASSKASGLISQHQRRQDDDHGV
jgi:hypothetical protein